MALGCTGVALALAAVLGLPEQGTLWLSMLVWLALWTLYLSFVNVGQAFYGFVWETLLLEAGFLAIFLGNARTAPPLVVILLIRWLVIRLELGAGLIKLRHDRAWRDLSALNYHHETQPLPNPWSWHFHRLPSAAHKVEVAASHVSQLLLPVALLLPLPVAAVAGSLIVVTQLWLILSGNYAWLNFLTIALAVSSLHDPPRFVRVRLYRYRYTTRQERRTSGAWWSRELVDEYLPPLTLRPATTPRPGVEAA